VTFSAIFFFSFVYIVAKGALDWGPVNKMIKAAPELVSQFRTTSNTIKRVGLEGREDEAA
jgi:NADH-quinone oxidoreductase subunit A